MYYCDSGGIQLLLGDTSLVAVYEEALSSEEFVS